MAQVTPNMQLVVWNNPTDLYDSSQLAKNFIAIDEHDHSGNGKGKAIDGTNIKVGTISSTQIANNTITAGNIAPSAVNTDELVDSSVTTAKIANTAVTTGKIANTAVTTDKFATSVQEQMGFDTSTVKRKRYKYIPAEATVSSTTTVLAGATGTVAADQISNLVVADPGNNGFGIINFAYLAQWRRSSNLTSGAVAEVYLSNGTTYRQAYVLSPSGGTYYTGPCRTAIPVSSSETSGTDMAGWRPLHTINGGFVLGNSNSTSNNEIASVGTINGKADIGVGVNGLWGNGNFNYNLENNPSGSTWLYSTDNPAWTSNQVPFMMPPAIQILVPSGTYTIEVRFAKGSTGGNMLVKQRHMWAWTESFVKE